MGFIGVQPTSAPLTTSDITDGIVSNAKLGADSVNAAKISDDSISDEHLDITSITGQTAITSLADTDKFLVSDASDSGNLKYVENQYLGGGATANLLSVKVSDGTASSYLTHNNIFSATYDFYKLIGFTNASAVDGNLRFRWLSGGSEINGSYYRNVGQGVNLDSSGSESHTLNVTRFNDSKFDLTDTTNNNNNFGDFFEITLAGMFDRDEGLSATLKASINQFRSNSNYRQYQVGGFYGNQGANENYDGFRLWYSNANVQYYSYAVYGFKKW